MEDDKKINECCGDCCCEGDTCCCKDEEKKNILIQISFAGDSETDVIRRQLLEVVEKYEGAKFAHLFLPRHIVKQKNFPTTLVDLLDECLGSNQYNPLAKIPTFGEYMIKLDDSRKELAKETDLLIILGTNIAAGVMTELTAKHDDIIFWK